MCVGACACVYVYEISEFTLHKNENYNEYSEFLFIKKERGKRYVLPDEIPFFVTAYILYECILL